MFKRFLSILLLLLAAIPAAHAEDIDLFTGVTSSTTAASNLLLVIDNSANFSANTAISGSTCTIAGATNTLSGTVGGVEQCVLYSVVSSITVSSTASLNLGILVYNASNVVDYNGAACPSSNVGGCVVYPMTGLTTTTKATLLTYIKNWKTSNGGNGSRWLKANSQATAASMQEAWAYYAGRTGFSGTNYSSFAPTTNCKNFILFLSNATSNNTTPGDQTGPQDALEGNYTAIPGANAYPSASTGQKAIISSTTINQVTACGTLTAMPSNHNNAGYYADEWARYMRASSLKITTYSVALVLPGSCKPDIPWLLASMADVGGGKYFATTDASELNAAISAIVSEVRSVNSVFAAVSLPVSTVNKNNFLNQIFIGMFRPDSDGLPRWQGNLKQYRADYVNNVLRTVDADGTAAVSGSGSEFLAVCARSYWTPVATATGDGYWTSYTDPNCTGYPATSNSPDGSVVEKGGQGYNLRKTDPSVRTVKTCSSSFASCTSLTDFATTNAALTTTLFGAADASSLSDLINWARGQNDHVPGETASLNGSLITSSSMRPSAHGGVVHSRPAAFNFGTDADRKVVVFYGGDDGILRAINGNRTTTFAVNSANVAAGDEFWAFVPPEFYGKYKRLYDNEVGISAANPKDYGMDGPLTAYKASGGDGWIFAGMRRGGRALYAFRVDPTTLAITLKWKRGCGDYTTTNCTNDGTNGDWRNIGQTWGTPQVFQAQASGATPLIIMGGGYDAACEDTISYGSCAGPIGNRIYVMDANSGSLSATFTTTRSVTADVTVGTDSSGYATYIYASDLAGNIYRISGPLSGGKYTPIGTNAASNWVITTIAKLGCDTGSACTSPPNRKLMFAPEVVFDGTSYIVLVGSGDREKPTNTSNATTNYFFAVKDRPDLGASYLADTANCGSGATALCLSSLYTFAAGTTPTAAQLASKPAGYAIQMRPNEQVITAASAVFGTVYYSTHLPKASASTSCTVNLGDLTPRSFKYADASGTDVYTTRTDAGLSPDPVVGTLTLDNGTPVPVCIGCTGPLETTLLTSPGSVTNPAKIRSYWYIKK